MTGEIDAAYHLGRRLRPGGMDHDHYRFSALPTRPPLRWPGDARVAVVLAVVVESASTVPDAGQWVPGGHPSVYEVSPASLTDYGPRVGFFRLARMARELGIPLTVPVSDRVAAEAPRVLDVVAEEGWETVGHGSRADVLLTSAMTVEQEEHHLRAARDAIRSVTGAAPRGWMGTRMSESDRTPALAAAAGYGYLMDWGNDDQPYTFTVPTPSGSPLVSVPTSVDLSDLLVMGDYAQTPWDYADALLEHLEVLADEGSSSGRSMTVTLHAQHSGQAFRARHVRRFLEAAASVDGVWWATAGQVTQAFLAATGPGDTLAGRNNPSTTG